jgi:hypothetical protein
MDQAGRFYLLLHSQGGYVVAQQAGWGILSNWLSEFSGDIGKKISRKH